jgi:hypothetical protein
VLLPLAAAAQPRQDRPVLEAVPVSTPPTLDGNVLTDPAWASAPVSSDFWQITPDDGAAASERTEVRIVYTATTLYIGVVCHDRTPTTIVASDSRRDASLDDVDSFRDDSRHISRRQNGFVFGTSAAGIEYDGQVARTRARAAAARGGTSAGRVGRRLQPQLGRRVDRCASRSAEHGWSAEFAIPFKHAAYRPGTTRQTWGINFQRNIQRKNEKAFWARLDRQYTISTASPTQGRVTGLEVPAQRNLKVMPYGLVSGTTVRGGDTGGHRDTSAEFR